MPGADVGPYIVAVLVWSGFAQGRRSQEVLPFRALPTVTQIRDVSPPSKTKSTMWLLSHCQAFSPWYLSHLVRKRSQDSI